MNPGDALDLRDIHLPAEPGWWPPAPGWWLLALLAALGLVWALRQWARWARRRRRRVAADKALQAVLSCHPEPGVERLAALSELARRICRQHASDKLSTRGDDWLAFLDEGSDSGFFCDGEGRIMLHGPFLPAVAPAAVEALTEPLRRRFRQIAEQGHA